jgi:hypothetical protein
MIPSRLLSPAVVFFPISQFIIRDTPEGGPFGLRIAPENAGANQPAASWLSQTRSLP